MKKIIGMFVVLTGMTAAVAVGGQTAQAFEGGDCGHGMMEKHHHMRHWSHERHNRMEKMAAQLGLTDQQKAKIKEIFKQNQQQAQPIREKLFAERHKMRAQVMSEKTDESAIRAEATKIGAIEGDMAIHRAQMMKQIRSVLTPEQQAKFKEMQKERKSKFEKFRNYSGEKRMGHGWNND